MRVVTHGLVEGELNGRKGTAVSFDEGYYLVELDVVLEDGTCEMSLEPCNLRLYKRRTKRQSTVVLYLLCVCEQQ
jgi:hypothetical protein